MESIRRFVGHRRADGNCYQPHPDVVRLYFIPYVGVTHRHLHDSRFLDEHEALHPGCQEKPAAVPIGFFSLQIF